MHWVARPSFATHLPSSGTGPARTASSTCTACAAWKAIPIPTVAGVGVRQVRGGRGAGLRDRPGRQNTRVTSTGASRNISQSACGNRGSVRLQLTVTVPAPQPRTVRLLPGGRIGTTRATGTLSCSNLHFLAVRHGGYVLAQVVLELGNIGYLHGHIMGQKWLTPAPAPAAAGARSAAGYGGRRGGNLHRW